MSMFYGGAKFSVGRFIYQSIIPVTLGKDFGGALLGALPFWFLYGRGPSPNVQTGQPVSEKKDARRGANGSDTTIGGEDSSPRGYDRDGMASSA